MIFGNQSTLNDLNALQQFFQSEIEDAKQVNLDNISQIESGYISTGSMLQDRPIGVYHFNSDVVDSGLFDISSNTSSFTNGCGLYLKNTANANYGILQFVNWAGDAFVGTKREGVVEGVYKYLTTKNTIVDSNGFIKTA